LDIDKQRTLSASAVEENVQWKAIPIDLPQEDNSYVSTAEIARKLRLPNKADHNLTVLT
jgi:hypothetical protein